MPGRAGLGEEAVRLDEMGSPLGLVARRRARSYLHNTTAAWSGSVPVYRIAECCGRSLRALR